MITAAAAQSSLIAKATNNQTLLKAVDFATLDDEQRQLEEQFSRLANPWYYERKRNYWRNVIDKDKNKRGKFVGDDGLPRVIKFRDTSQRACSFLGEPIIAKDKSGLIFKKVAEGGYKEHVFPSGIRAEQLLLPWLVYERIAKKVEETIEQTELSEREFAREMLQYGRLTAVALVGDALRKYYKVEPMLYFDLNLTKELLDKLDKWGEPIAESTINYILNVAKEKKNWRDSGARSTFRKMQTYDQDLKPGYITFFVASKSLYAPSLPSI